ncbi:MAG: LemA family protein [Bacteroidetes bacterium]|nr:LemA family protein [Bacteroidota bacterium]
MATNQRSRVWLILVSILVILSIYIGVTYNKLVKQDENVKLNWGNLQNSYQRRLDLTPNLVAVVKASSDYEKQTLEQLAAARAKAMQVTTTGTADINSYNAQEQAQGEVANSINRVIGVIERYPDLKTTKSFVYLQSQLEGTERRIKTSRNDFNLSVANYNKMVRGFPSNIAASVFGFKAKEGFKADAGSENAPEVKF